MPGIGAVPISSLWAVKQTIMACCPCVERRDYLCFSSDGTLQLSSITGSAGR